MGAYSQYSYVEVAKYVPNIKSVIREKRDGESVMLKIGDQVDKYRNKYNNTGVYTSVFRYKEPNLGAVSIAPLYFDLDSDDLKVSHRDARFLYSYLNSFLPPDSVRVYFTGSKGFHLEVDHITLGVSPSMDLPNTYKLIAEDCRDRLNLTSIDFPVYEPRRMWRMVDSCHQKTGLYKVELLEGELLSPLDEILSIAESPRHLEDPALSFDVQANEWIKSWTAKLEEIKYEKQIEAKKRRIELFNKYGSSIAHGPSKKYVKKVWKSAIDELKSAKPGKDRNITLSRQAYKLYIVALEANIDLDSVTNRLYNIGLGMELEDREVKATLNSAKRAAIRKHEEKEGVING